MQHSIRTAPWVGLAACSVIFTASCTYDWPSPQVDPDSGQEAGIEGGVDGVRRDGAAFDASLRPDSGARPDAGAPREAGTPPDAAYEPDAQPDLGEPCDQADALRCTGQSSVARERCSDGYWGAATACADGEVCTDTPSPGSCVEVAEVCRGNAGQAVCDAEGTMYLCGDNGVPEEELSCGSQRLCEAGTDQQACLDCVPNEYRCTEAKLEQCVEDGSGFALVEECSTVALCNADAGACTDAACSPDVAKCEDNELHECNASRTDFQLLDTCDSAELCDADNTECDTCLPSTTRCSGNSVVTCAADGQSTTADPCTEPAPLCIGNGTCVECRDVNDCPPVSNPCRTRSCNAGTGRCEESDKTVGASCDGNNYCSSNVSCEECLTHEHCRTKYSDARDYCVGYDCVQCRSGYAEQDCPTPTQQCRRATCNDGECGEEIAEGSRCNGDGFCSSTGSCEDCLTHSDCQNKYSDYRDRCASNTCVECTLDFHCQGHPEGSRCDGNRCVECANDSHCGGDLQCSANGVCVGCGNGIVEPGLGESCDTAAPGETTFKCSPDCQRRDLYDALCYDSTPTSSFEPNPVCDDGASDQVCIGYMYLYCAPNVGPSAPCPELTGGYRQARLNSSSPYCMLVCDTADDCPDHLSRCFESSDANSDASFHGVCTWAQEDYITCERNSDCPARMPDCSPGGYCISGD